MGKIDILLVYPRPTKSSSVRGVPLSILYPGALFKSQGLRVEYWDQRFDSQDMLEDMIKNSREIACSVMTGEQCGEAADILIRAKQLNPGIIGALGGPHAILLPEQVMTEPFVDKVYAKLSYGEDLFPYDEQTHKHFARTEMMYQTSIGCPFGCRFCMQTQPWRPRPIEQIDYELSTIHEATGFTEIGLVDQNLAFHKYRDNTGSHKVDKLERMRAICKILKKLGVDWTGALRCPDLTPQMVKVLAESGCKGLHLGAESGSERVLRNIVHKGHGVEAIKQSALNARDSGISVLYTFITDMPGETADDVRHTMDLVDWLSDNYPEARKTMYQYVPYPGSKMYEDAIAGRYGYKKFHPPTNLKSWSRMNLMNSPLYWITGLNFRLDQTQRNFPGSDWKLIEPYVNLAREKWATRDFAEFPCDEVEQLIQRQVVKMQSQAETEAA